MKMARSLLALAALAALAAFAAPPVGIGAGAVPVTSGSVAARPVGPQPALTMVRPTIGQAPLIIAQPFAVTPQPIVIGQPFAIAQPLAMAPLVVTTLPPAVATPQAIVIGQPFAIMAGGIVQQQIPVTSGGVLVTTQGAGVVAR